MWRKALSISELKEHFYKMYPKDINVFLYLDFRGISNLRNTFDTNDEFDLFIRRDCIYRYETITESFLLTRLDYLRFRDNSTMEFRLFERLTHVLLDVYLH